MRSRRTTLSTSSGFPGVVLVYLAHSAEDVAKTLRAVEEAGGEIVNPVTKTPYGVAGFFCDPDGHLFEVD